jgi:hypothetical protein
MADKDNALSLLTVMISNQGIQYFQLRIDPTQTLREGSNNYKFNFDLCEWPGIPFGVSILA